METIVHRIRLNPGVPPERFERWVRDVDYATCPELPSVRAFRVLRVPDRPPAGCHYIEVIEVTSQADFARDMLTPPFRRLVADFEQLASVVDELSGERVGEGYTAD
ncbi:RedY protein [Streptomyces sp. URMC 123]|uniref:RedY protein n=1 Tax=Streptomyces sp. URMC 123 TaxID=3423403 RepID=UPI003F1A137E